MPSLSPPPKFAATFLDDDGVFQPAIGWKLYTYAATTSTPKDTYTSIGMGAANTNPIILDARGECDLWLNGAYKFILKDDLDQTIWEVDEIRDLTLNPTFTNATLAGTLTISSTAVTWSGNPTHSGNHEFSGNVSIFGNTRIGNATSDSLTIEVNTVTWTAATTTHAGNHSIVGDLTVGDDLVVVGDLTIAGGGLFASTYTPTLTPVTNSASRTAFTVPYLRIGSMCLVQVYFSAEATAAAGTLTRIGISLPVASNFGAPEDCGGTANAGANSNMAGMIQGDSSNNRADIQYSADTVNARTFSGLFMYRII